jgi:hypothetical protein
VGVPSARNKLSKNIGVWLNAHTLHHAKTFINFAKLFGATVCSNDLYRGENVVKNTKATSETSSLQHSPQQKLSRSGNCFKIEGKRSLKEK